MITINKFVAYTKLSEIKSKFNSEKVIEAADNHIKRVFNEDTVPYDTIVFINEYEPLDQLSVYNRIYNNRRRNPLYKNLVNENLSLADKAIALNSLLTQILINNKKLEESNKKEDAELFKDFMSASEIHNAVVEYLKGNNDKLLETFDMVRDTLKRLYNNNKNT